MVRGLASVGIEGVSRDEKRTGSETQQTTRQTSPGPGLDASQDEEEEKGWRRPFLQKRPTLSGSLIRRSTITSEFRSARHPLSFTKVKGAPTESTQLSDRRKGVPTGGFIGASGICSDEQGGIWAVYHFWLECTRLASDMVDASWHVAVQKECIG